MKKIILAPLHGLARLFLGKGIVDKYAPFLIKWYQKLYSNVQKSTEEIVTIPLGKKLIVNPADIGVGIPLVVHKAYEPILTDLFINTVKQGATVVDIGANIGYYSILAGEKTGTKGKVIAFEPDKFNLPLLKKNVSINNLDNVSIIEKAVSDTNGTVTFSSHDMSKGDSSIAISPTKGSYEVQSTTLDHFFSTNTAIQVMKIDIEGAELLALKGAKKLLSQAKDLHLFIEYNPTSLKAFKTAPDELLKLIESYGFSIVSIIDEPKHQILPYNKDNLNQVLSYTTFTNLYCKK